jgi:hypothetical protein
MNIDMNIYLMKHSTNVYLIKKQLSELLDSPAAYQAGEGEGLVES